MNLQAITPTSAEVSPQQESVTKPRCRRLGCLNELEQKATGRPPIFCSAACRVAWHRRPSQAARLAQRNKRVERLTRDQALGFDGRLGGPRGENVPFARNIRALA